LSLKKYIHQVKPREESYVNHVDRIQDLFLNEAKFGPVNFPNQAKQRTVYPPYTGESQSTSSPDGNYTKGDLGNPYNFPEGFPVSQNTFLYTKDGEKIEGSEIKKGTPVHFVDPADLHLNGSWMAQVSLKGWDKKPDGYIAISHVEKPPGQGQKRVAKGTEAQEACFVHVKKICEDKGLKVAPLPLGIAPSGSTKPDLIMEIEGKRVQFEIKGTDDRKKEITFFDITARRKQNRKSQAGKEELDAVAELFIIQGGPTNLKKALTDRSGEWYKLRKKKGNEGGAFHAIMEYSKNLNSTIGYAGDENVVKSGKLPSVLKTTNKTLMNQIHAKILEHFIKGGDDYFAVHNRSSNTFEIYNVNIKNDILKKKTLPQFTAFKLATYGGPSAAGTRVGFKIKFPVKDK
jgi:hypothetical protein